MSLRAGMNPRRLFVVCALAGMMVMPAPALAQLRARPYVSGLSFPVAFIPDPTRPGRHFVVEQMGHVRVVVDGVLQDRDSLDVSSLVTPRTPIEAERGLIGMVLAPDCTTSGRFSSPSLARALRRWCVVVTVERGRHETGESSQRETSTPTVKPI